MPKFINIDALQIGTEGVVYNSDEITWSQYINCLSGNQRAGEKEKPCAQPPGIS